MYRLCFLQSVTAGFDACQIARQLADRLGDPFAAEVRTIGHGGDYPGLLRSLRPLRADGWDLIHAWDRPSLMAALASGAARVVVTPPADEADAVIRLARTAAIYRPVQVVCPTAALHRLAVRSDIPEGRCHLIHPGIDLDRISRQPDRELRRELGFTDDQIVLLAAGESTPAAGHELAVWATAILRVVQPAYRLVIWGRGPAVDKVERFIHGIGDPDGTLIAERRLRRPIAFEELLAVGDIALVTARDAVNTLPIVAAMAAGLPIISTTTPPASELLEDQKTALMVAQPQARQIAQRVIDLRSNADMQQTLRENARSQAHTCFAQSRMIDQYRDLYYRLFREGGGANEIQ